MPLVDSKNTAIELIQANHELAIALLSEAIEALVTGEPEVCRLLLRDLVNATIGFEPLAIASDIPPKSLHRMLSAKGNPSMGNLSRIIQILQSNLNIEIRISSNIAQQELVWILSELAQEQTLQPHRFDTLERLSVFPVMGRSESEKEAQKKYESTEKGKAARKRALKKYAESEQGQEKISEAQKRFEQTEARKEYKRKKQREYRARRKEQQKKNEES